MPQQHLLAKYESWKASQRRENPYDLPIGNQLREVVSEVLRMAPETSHIYLTGSYASGAYITETTPQEYWDLKKELKKQVKISDIDIVVEPYFDPKIPGVDVQKVYRPNRLLLYSNPNL